MAAPVLKAPPPAPVTSWTGCYLDAGGGYGMSNTDHNGENFTSLVRTATSETSGGRGWLGRFGGGCDYQFSLGGLGNWTIGALADYDVMNIHGGFSPGNLGFVGTENESSAWSVGGRLGYLMTPTLLTFVSGGYTQARFDQINLSGIFAPFAPTATIGSQTYHGWFLGGGAEYAMNLDWLPIRGLFWRTEYRFSTYNSTDLPVISNATGLPGVSAVACGGACGEHIQPYTQTITSSLVWRFNWAGPVVARY